VLLDTCAIGTIFRRNSGELKAGKKRALFEKKTTKSAKKLTKTGEKKKN